MTYHRPPKKIRLVLIFIIILLIGLLLTIFIKNRMSTRQIHPPLPPENTGADLTIKRFRHTATTEGERQWSVEAESASLYSKEKRAQLIDISVTFYLSEDQCILVTADQGSFDLQSNEMTAAGDIVAKGLEYTLKTQSLHYDHRLHIIQLESPVTLTGPGVMLKADTLSYDLKTGKVICAGNVEGSIREIAQK